MEANQMIREKAKKRKVNLWQIAAYLGVSEPTMTRWMRLPLSEDREKKILAAIDEIAKGVS